MPAAPTERDDLFDVLGYFATLQSFLTYSFGWTRHDKGLIWWGDAGMPVEDSRFALIRDVWVADGLLDVYIDWCVRHPVMNVLDEFSGGVDHSPVELSPEWRRRLQRSRATDGALATPEGKHLELGGHIAGPSEKGSGRLVELQPESGSAVLLSDSIFGWYHSLSQTGRKLPPLSGGGNWRIDVYVKPIGFVGTYRRSRETGLWFAGRHAHHSVGN